MSLLNPTKSEIRSALGPQWTYNKVAILAFCVLHLLMSIPYVYLVISEILKRNYYYSLVEHMSQFLQSLVSSTLGAFAIHRYSDNLLRVWSALSLLDIVIQHILFWINYVNWRSCVEHGFASTDGGLYICNNNFPDLFVWITHFGFMGIGTLALIPGVILASQISYLKNPPSEYYM